MTSADLRIGRGRERAPATALFLFLGALLALSLPACDRRTGGVADEVGSLAGRALGTSWSVKWRTFEGAPSPDELRSAIEAELESVDAAMSTWRDDSELSAWNRARTTDPIPVSPELAEVVAHAIDVARRTGGAFDPTVGPLVDAWGFGAASPALSAELEPPADLELLRARTGWEHLRLDRESGTLAKAVAGLELDLSGIAKGWVVDRISASLEALGVEQHLVEVGGEVVAHGEKAPGRRWTVGVEKPLEGMRGVHRAFPLHDAGLATSGDYRNYREVGGQRVSHLIDPRTGRPASHRLASVSVVAESCTEADALATALMVLGPDDGPAVAEREGAAALFLVRSDDGFTEVAAGGFDEWLAEHGQNASTPGDER